MYPQRCVKILLYYDYICPFCFMATERVLGLAKEFDLEAKWLGVEIHPEYPAEGKRRRKTERTLRISKTLENIAAEAGVEIKLPGFVTNSRLCLEGAEFAKEKKQVHGVSQGLLRGLLSGGEKHRSSRNRP